MRLRQAAETAVHQCLGLDAEESCLIVTDDEREPIGRALYAVAGEVTDDVALIQYPPGDQHGEEPGAAVAAAMSDTDTFLAPTTKSLSHTRARSEATEAGARGATLPGITESIFETGLQADYEEIAAQCASLTDQLADATEIRVTAPNGTDITLWPGEREWREDTGIIHESGDFSNLPAGEVFVSPEDATGRFVVDGTMMPYGLLEADQSLAFEVEDGMITEIDDEGVRKEVETAAEAVGDAAYNLAELGVGANIAVTELVGSVLLDEKAAGTVHLAIGDDAGIGGDTEAPIHQDGIIRNPTVYADGDEVTLPSPDAADI